MTWRQSGQAACVLTLAMWVPGGRAQTNLPQTPTDALHQLDRLAGVIFTGEVVAVHQHEGANGASGVVEIVFSVQDAIRGVSADTYTVREWAGLWAANDERFRVGQRYLMMLHAPGAGGLSSPVGGMDGAIPIRGGGTGAQGDEPIVDLRWVATRVVRPVVYRSASAQPIVAHAKGVTSTADGSGTSGSASSAPVSSDAQNAGYVGLMGMLRDWEKNDHATQ